MLTRAGELQRAKNRATRAKINTQKYTVIADRAKKASVKYAECGCDQLKKDIDANKAGFFTKLFSTYTGNTLSGIAETRAQVKEQRLVEATRNYEKEFRENQEKQVRAGALSRELADSAIREFQEHLKDVEDGAKQAREIARRAASQQRKSENSAKGAFQQKQSEAAAVKTITHSAKTAATIEAKAAAAAAAAAAATAATAPPLPLKLSQTRRSSNNNKATPNNIARALRREPPNDYRPPVMPMDGGHGRTRRR